MMMMMMNWEECVRALSLLSIMQVINNILRRYLPCQFLHYSEVQIFSSTFRHLQPLLPLSAVHTCHIHIQNNVQYFVVRYLNEDLRRASKDTEMNYSQQSQNVIILEFRYGYQPIAVVIKYLRFSNDLLTFIALYFRLSLTLR